MDLRIFLDSLNVEINEARSQSGKWKYSHQHRGFHDEPYSSGQKFTPEKIKGMVLGAFKDALKNDSMSNAIREFFEVEFERFSEDADKESGTEMEEILEKFQENYLAALEKFNIEYANKLTT
jgi:hypothetical protein